MKKIIALILFYISAAFGQQALASDTIWFEQPARAWDQALPLGNGHLGMLPFGTIDEFIIFNEDTLWSGWPEKNDRPGSYEALKHIRKLIRDGAPQETIAKAVDPFYSLHGYGKPDFGAHQSFFNAHISFGHDSDKVTDYKRSLDISTATAEVSYKYEGIKYSREYFCSYPADITIMRFSADKAGSLDMTLAVSSLHKKTAVSIKDNRIILDGQVDTGSSGKKGMKFQAQLAVEVKGGKITQTRTSGQFADGKRLRGFESPAIRITGADEVIIRTSGATDYKLAWPEYVGQEPAVKNDARLAKAVKKTFAQLRAEHIADFQNIFNRVELKLAGKDLSNMPTDKRRAAYRRSKDDPGLEALLFQFGRYLMISSSRPGTMPANLQGLWNNSNTPPWNCDYHLNINLQMNYWPVDSCNMSECALPLVRWLEDLTKPGTETAKVHYNSPGWVAHHCCNVWGFTSPGPNRGIHMLEPESGAFLCQNLWDHYAFTADSKFLEQTAWPIMKGAAEFWIANLQEVEGGRLAVSPSYSPEQGPLTDGTYYQTMIIWDLFTNCITATEIMDRDKDFAAKLKTLRDRLQPLKIGEYGQLQEWRDSQLPEEKKSNKNRHRHVSHMFSAYPGKQIVATRDKELTKAAIQTMNFRGDGATGWSLGWKVNIWARLLDGNRAHKLITGFVSSKVSDNLWCQHPPFQIDGNFGYTAGVAEMLVQSHVPTGAPGSLGRIHLLPSLPDKWATGTVSGLKARGGILITKMTWRNKALKEIEVVANNDGDFTFLCDGSEKTIKLKAGQPMNLSKYLAR